VYSGLVSINMAVQNSQTAFTVLTLLVIIHWVGFEVLTVVSTKMACLLGCSAV
jgi:hypothetical protein